MKKKLIALHAVLALGISSVMTIPTAYAEDLSDLNQKKDKIQEQQSDVKVDLNETEEKINKLQEKQLTVEEQLVDISEKLQTTTEKIEQKNEEIKKTNEEIKALQVEIDLLKERIAARDEILKERAVSFQESGGSINYLEVLFGSADFTDLFNRLAAVATIAEADREILEQHEQDKKDLEVKQAAVKEKLANLEAMKAELEEMEAQQSQQKQQKEALMEKIKEQKEHAEEYKVSLEEEQANLAAQETAIQEAINLEENRLAELEAARKRAAEEAKRREAEAKAAEAKAAAERSSSSSSSSSTTSSSSSSPSVQTVPPVSSGTFTRPSAGVVTSQMGPRWNKQHAGIDIAAGGTVPIVAAADGVVSRSYYSDSYGNVIFITHSIGGQLYTTVYAHLSSRQASSGQVVAKGEQIGYMGNTGRSYGQHLHFEVHKGPWNVSKSNAVNPLNFVSY